MKDWFKARNIWGAAIMALSDAEAGRLAKALWSYTMSNEEQNLSGAERGIFAMIQMQLDLDNQTEAEISAKRAEAGAMGGKQTQANASKEKQSEANQANADNKNKNKNKEKEEDIKKVSPYGDTKESVKRFTPPTLEEVKAYCAERGNQVNAERWFDFYASKGWKVGNQSMKDWKAAVRTWEQRDNNTANRTPLKMVHAQNYTQRQYTESELAGDSGEELLRQAAML
jgi:hypothetical protein